MYLPKYKAERLLLLFFCIVSFAARAQPSNKDSGSAGTTISPAGFSNFMKTDSGAAKADAMLDSLQQVSSGAAADSISDMYRNAKLKYGLEAYDHRHRVFEWQLSSSKYIFFMVIVIVLVGLLLSVWQFYLPIYKMNRQMKANNISKEVSQTVVEDENKDVQVSSLKLGKDGVEITSLVIGLLILVISIAFFFLYIRYVYPISEISAPQTEQAGSSK